MMRGLLLGALVIALTGCAATPTAPTLDEVAEERSHTVTEQWRLAANAATEYLEAEWPEAVYPPLRFERWVEPERQLADLLQCMNRVVDRTAGSIGETGLLVLNPRPTGEPAWELPVAQVRCSLQVIAWTGLYPFGGPVEQAWVRHQVTVALPACVRRWGADLEIVDLDAAIDASIYPTSSGRSVEPLQSVWLAAQLRNADEATARQIRATCPDPGRTLIQLGPAEIRS
ncbi:hypothetical protein [Microcella sp.]|uniref:hypothetical protein n=1 Tax=Microcella sp. TaxID=1913979 RepID=UPI00256234FB|nr:hypothetical protein [Microcella sp.]MBX9470589.1 hypothetical protein [Microcella sp.]